MKVGDLVNFTTGAARIGVAEKKYTNPGIILSEVGDEAEHRMTYKILWSDKRITYEFASYLREFE
tara:strand:+ start:953 stop:1147 length:195 start_codon:yes stop_codon:yes gene_type:complete